MGPASLVLPPFNMDLGLWQPVGITSDKLRTFRPRTELSACPVLVVLKKSSVNGEVVELS